MKRILLVLSILLQCFPIIIFAQQPCNVNDAIKLFNQAQQAEGTVAADLFKQAAAGFKCAKQWNNYAVASYSAANNYLIAGNTNQSKEILEQSLTDIEGKLDPKSSAYMLILHTLGEICFQQADYTRSVEYFQRAKECIATGGGANSKELAVCLFNLGNSYEQLQQYSSAISCHRRSIAIKESLDNADESDIMRSYSVLSALYRSNNQHDSSLYFSNKAQGITSATSSSSGSAQPQAHTKFAVAQQRYNEGRLDEAQQLFTEVRQQLESAADQHSNLFISTILYLGLIREQAEDNGAAHDLLLLAYQKSSSSQTPDNNMRLSVAVPYARVLHKLGRNSSAIDILNSAMPLAKNTQAENEIIITLAKVYESNSDFERARNYYRSALTNMGTDSVGNAIYYAQALVGLGSICDSKNQPVQAIGLYERAVTLLPTGEVDFRADIYSYIGGVYVKMKNYAKAMENYRRAYSMLEVAYGATSLRVLSMEEGIANAHMLQGEYSKAIAIYTKSLAEKTKQLGYSNVGLIDLYNNLGSANYSISNIDEAGRNYSRALEISQKHTVAANKLDGLYNNLAIYYRSVGNIKAALAYITSSIEIKTRLYGAEHTNTASAVNNLGTIYDKQGNFNQALDCFDRAEMVLLKAKEGESLDISEVYINKGNLYNKLGQNNLALDYYNKALSIKTKHLSADSPQLAAIYNNIGTVYQNLDELQQARASFQKALDLRVRFIGEHSHDVAESYNNMGNILLKAGDNIGALRSYKKAYSIYSTLSVANPMQIGNTYNNIATAYFIACAFDSSQVFFLKAANVYSEVFGGKHPYLALIYNGLGDLCVKIDKHEQALKYYNLAISANHSGYDSNSPFDVLPTMNGYFDQKTFMNTILSKSVAFVQKYIKTDSLSRDRGNLYTALNHLFLCDSIVQNMRKSATTKLDKMMLGETALKCYEVALEVCTELMNIETDAGKKRYFMEYAYLFLEKGKANALLESMAGQDALDLANIPDSLKQIERALSADLQYFERSLAENPKNELAIRDSLFNANKKYSELIKHLESTYPNYYELKNVDRTISLSELQSKIGDNTQLRVYMNGTAFLFVMIIERNECYISSRPIIANLRDTVRLYRNTIIQTTQRSIRDYQKMAFSLYQYLFPDNPSNEKIKHIVVVPDGRLSQIPFESLLYEPHKGGFYEFTSYPYLLRRFAVSYAFSSSLYHRNITNNRAAMPKSWLGFAPVFAKSIQGGVVLNTRLGGKELVEDVPQALNMQDWASLPSSEAEVRKIFNMFSNKGYRAKACLFGSANKQNFTSDSVAGYKYIHLATHGFVNSDEPDLSGIQFYSTNNDNQGGVLYSSSVYGLKFNSDLIVLSACETGLGKIMKGEGIVGLSRAFIYAGISNLCASLWKVSDASTADLMTDFYGQLMDAEVSNVSYAMLMRQAKLNVISRKKFAAPYFWSPFIIIGN